MIILKMQLVEKVLYIVYFYNQNKLNKRVMVIEIYIIGHVNFLPKGYNISLLHWLQVKIWKSSSRVTV